MPHTKGAPLTAAEHAQKVAASKRSPWRRPYDPASKRQRDCAKHFAKLAEAGDSRRIPRPELD